MELQVKLSDRLLNVTEFLPNGAKFADIGSDHAYLPCYVCRKDENATAIAGEVNQGPFESAKKNVRRYGLDNRISVRLGNGLEVIDKIDAIKQIVIAGMGGGLIKDILEQGKDKLESVERLILQPNVDARQLRIWLEDNGFTLVGEKILKEKDHIYEILVADRHGESPYAPSDKDKQMLFGPYLLQEKSPIFHRKWQSEQVKLRKVINQMKQAVNPNEQKINEFEKELAWMKEVLSIE